MEKIKAQTTSVTLDKTLHNDGYSQELISQVPALALPGLFAPAAPALVIAQ